MSSLHDNFEAYTVGDLNTQGGWSGDTNFDVQTSTVFNGSKAISAASDTSNRVCTKSFSSAVATGSQSWYMRAAQTDKNGGITIYNNSATFESNIHFRDDGNIKYYDGTSYITVQAYSANVWYKFDLEWRVSDHSQRMRVNNGSWTAWDTTVTSTWNSIDSLALNTTNVSGGTFLWDFFKPQGQLTPRVIIL